MSGHLTEPIGDLEAWLARPEGPAHRAHSIDTARTACHLTIASMRRTTLTACATHGITICDVCWPAVGQRPGWPLRTRGRAR